MKGAGNSKTSGPWHWLSRLGFAVLALGLTVAVVACDGDGNGNNSPTAGPTQGGTPGAEPTGAASPTAQATQPTVSSPACEALASLDKYRYISNVTLESPEEIVPESEGGTPPVPELTREFTGRFLFDYSIDASLISPDRVAAEIQAGVGEPFNITVIGDRHWITAGGQWQEAGTQYIVPYQPLEICNAILPQIDLDSAQGQDETINSVDAQHYTLNDVPSGGSMATIFGPESDMALLFQTMDVEVWLEQDDGWPVRMDIKTSGLYGDRRELTGHIEIELRDIDADDITVEPPI